MELIYIAFVVVYGLLLGLLAPYILGDNRENYGMLVAPGVAIVSGVVLWSIFTWVGLSANDAWIWLLVMLSMPVAVWFGVHRLVKIRLIHDEEALKLAVQG